MGKRPCKSTKWIALVFCIPEAGRCCTCAALAAILSFARLASGDPSAPHIPRYEQDVRPILAANCFRCHGPDAGAREADLRLDTAVGAYADLGGRMAVKPGDPAESELILRITSADDAERMPPDDSGKTLDAKQIDTLRAWIADGAKYEPHWSFVSPRRPEPPAVTNANWPRNEIDRFVLARLQQEGLSPTPEANRYELARRAFLDLIGLPPLPAEADAFVNDPRPDAYERMVDRLLASPHYGERWARRWLDLARYSDTKGYEKDMPRTMWLYRDWVINAFNADMPFDQFTVEQLAGDMLPDASIPQRIATGFHRNTMTNEEGGVDPQEFRFQAMVDRVATTGATWLGLTVGCAQCHTHKYDPMTHREYYELFALLNNSDDVEIEVPLVENDQKRQSIQAEIDRLATRLESLLSDASAENNQGVGKDDGPTTARRAALKAAFSQWQVEQASRAVAWRSLKPDRVESNFPTTAVLADNSVLIGGDVTKNDVFKVILPVGEQPITAIRLEALPDQSLPGGGPGRQTIVDDNNIGNGNFFLSEVIARICHPSGQTMETLKWGDATASFAPPGISARNAVDGRYDTGWTIAGKEAKRHVAVFQFASPVVVPSGSHLELELQHENFYPASLGRFRISTTSAESPKATGFSDEIDAALLKSEAEQSVAEQTTLVSYFLQTTPLLAAEHAKIDELRGRMPRRPQALVLQERLGHPRVTHLHHRGEYLRPEEVVEPGVPEILPSLPAGKPRNRLSLARWLVSPNHPLTARVFVNRQWQAFFGRGLVRTTEDFGYQGEFPSHPKLLDWLAVEFVKCGWSMKQLHRQMVTSAAYRQSAAASPENRRRDPENIFISRGPRQRVEAELVRDAILKASGRLCEKIGGPSVFPPQPLGITEAAYKPLPWIVSRGEDRYRRGLYTFNKRTAPFAAFGLFDAPSGEACIPRRTQSNTPLQALALLNDEVVLDAARHMARTCLQQGGDETALATEMFRRCVTRPPMSEELVEIQAFVSTTLQRFRHDRGDCEKVLGVGPHFSWTFTDPAHEWEARNQCTLAVKDARLVVECTGQDPFFGIKLSGPAGRYTLRMRTRFGTTGPGELFWTDQQRPEESPDRRTEFSLQRNQWIDCEASFVAQGPLTGLRIDPGQSVGVVEIEGIELVYGDGVFALAPQEDTATLAAWTLAARALLNLDESITKP